MIRSMTAFARGERHGEWGSLEMELRSVNHRYLEMNVRLPEELRFLEMAIRERLGARLGRGKVECRLSFRPSGKQGELVINEELARQLAHASRVIDGMLYNPSAVNSMDILRWPDVLLPPKLDAELWKEQVLGLLDEVLETFTATRDREGAQLKPLIEQRCDAIESLVARLRTHLPELSARWRQRLQERLATLKEELDPTRLEQEVVLFAQKVDITEELDRLDTHVREVRRVLEQDEPVGRRLDFLMQELNREANTIASKAADAETTQVAVELKVLIEQMREQIQNIE